jgi:hypothetical protein
MDDDDLPILGDDVTRVPGLLLALGVDLLKGALELTLHLWCHVHDVAGELSERTQSADVATGVVHILVGSTPNLRGVQSFCYGLSSPL